MTLLSFKDSQSDYSLSYVSLLTILYVNQQGPQNLGQLNEKGNGSSPDPFFSAPKVRVKKKGLACDTTLL